MAIEDVVAFESRLGQWPGLDRQGVSMATPCKEPERSVCSTPIGVAQGRNARPLGSFIECAKGRDARPLIFGVLQAPLRRHVRPGPDERIWRKGPIPRPISDGRSRVLTPIRVHDYRLPTMCGYRFACARMCRCSND